MVGGRTEDKSVNLATLSGKQDLSNKLFVSASNFMIIKFSTDASVERKGFRLVHYQYRPLLRDEFFVIMSHTFVALESVSGMFKKLNVLYGKHKNCLSKCLVILVYILLTVATLHLISTTTTTTALLILDNGFNSSFIFLMPAVIIGYTSINVNLT
jgi:hypothetical protein